MRLCTLMIQLKILTTLYLCFEVVASILHSQKQGATWIVGYDSDKKFPPRYGKTEMRFTSHGLKLEYNTLEKFASTSFINTSICDSTGKLLLFTEGLNIYGADQKIILNGDGLNPGKVRDDYQDSHYPSIYSHVFLGRPQSNDEFFLVHLAVRWNENVADTIRPSVAEKLYYTRINQSNDNFIVIEKNILLLEREFVKGHMAYCRHANGRDWWIVLEEYATNLHFIFLLDPTGIRLHHQQNIGYGGNFYDYSGNSIFSQDGQKFAKYTYYNSIQIFDFDRCTGYFSNPVHINVKSFNRYILGSLAFSQETKYLYFNNLERIYQIDLQTAAGNYHIDTVGYWDHYYYNDKLPTAFFNMALGDDGIIYLGCFSSNVYLHTINSPDQKGSQCGFELRSVVLPALMNGALPIMPNFRLGAMKGSRCDSLSNQSTLGCNIESLLYCNFCQDEILLKDEIENGSVFNIFSLQGKFICRVQSANHRIDVSELVGGMYILSCIHEEKGDGIKFMKY
mgnify:CR=1 FL=1